MGAGEALRRCLMVSREITYFHTRGGLFVLILECYVIAVYLSSLFLLALLQVDEIYTVPEVGTVVGGTLSR